MATGKRKRHIRILFALAFLVFLSVATLAVSAHLLLNSDRVRRIAETAVKQYTGIEMRIADLHASLWTGRVMASGVAFSVPEAEATVDRVRVNVNLKRLLAREISISLGDIDGLVVRVPEDVGAIGTIIANVRQTVNEKTGKGDGSPALTVEIDRITAIARVYFDTDTEPFLVSDVQIDDLFTSRIGVHTDTALRAWGDAARFYGGVELLRAEPGSPWQVNGDAWLRGVQTERLPLTNAPSGLFAADLIFTPTDPGPGAEIHTRLLVPSQPEITGASTARGVWTGDRIDIAQFLWQSPSARLEAAGSYSSPDDWKLSVSEAHASEVSLDALLALFERPRASFEADPGAEVVLTALEADSVNGDWHIAGGDLGFSGLTIVSHVANPAQQGIAQALRGLRGTISADAGRIAVQEIRSDDVHIAGALFPDRTNQTLQVDLSADVELAHFPWTLLNEHGEVEDIAGRLAITKFAGTFSRGNTVPDDLELHGALENARLKYTDNVLAVDAREVSGTFSTTGNSVMTHLRATDRGGAQAAIAGAYDVNGRTWTGTLDADPSRIVPALLEPIGHADDIYAGAAALGPSVFDLRAEFPGADRDALTLQITRRDTGTTALEGRLTYANDAVTIDAKGTFPAERFVAEYMPRLRGHGDVQATFAYDQVNKRYAITADATGAGVISDSILRKSVGTPLTLSMSGAAAKNWTVESLDTTVYNAPAFRFTGPVRDGDAPFEAQLAPFAAFLPDGATAGGAVRGTLRFDPFGADVEIDGAALALSPDAALERVHGTVHLADGVFSCESLEVDGARSDATVSLTLIDNRWSGAATGTKLDIGAIVDLADAAQTVFADARTEGERGEKRSIWTDPIVGEFTVDLGEVYYRRGRLDAVSFRVLGEERAIRVPEFSARTGQGTMLGSFVVLPGEYADAVVKSALKWTGLDGRLLNDMLFPDDRGFFGTFDGEFTFDAPLGDYKTMLAGGSGSARWSAQQGSLGNIGFASKLLTALRTTEIITLRVPSLRDQGLSYKTWSADIAMANGIMTLKETQLDGGAYTITGTGTIDFAAEQTNVETFTRVLESVGKVVGSVPLIGNIATALSTDLIGVPVNFSGSPYDPKVSIVAATGKSVATAPLRAGEGALKAVGETLKKLIPGGNKKGEESNPSN